MTILSDREIRELCEPPKFVVTATRQLPMTPHAVLKTQDYTYLTHAGEEELCAEIALASQNNLTLMPTLGPRSYRPVTPEDLKDWKPMISPFEARQVRETQAPANVYSANDPRASEVVEGKKKVISYGLSSYGYDIRCSNEFKIFTNINSTLVDPKNFNDKTFVDMDADQNGGFVIIPPNSFALARTEEYFRIPRDILTVCLGKSTYARCGIIVNVTPFEPEWEGYVTLEFSNTTPLPAKIYAHEGCSQVLFFRNPNGCEVSYKDRGGKYQGQVGVTLPKA